MSVLFNCQFVSKSVPKGVLFKDLSLSIFSGDKIGLIGLNGCGKSTLMKIIAGLELPDSGTVAPKKGLCIGYVPQTCEFTALTPKEIVVNAMGDDVPDYDKERLAEMQLKKIGFKGDEPTADRLSGGWKKRLRLAVELIRSPELLLLDEPTNHLDLEGIIWLEQFLKKEAITYLLVSHDRYFLQHVTSRIIEIDKTYPEGVFSVDGTYQNFLGHKEKFLQGQIQQEKRLAGKARRETEWLRSGCKARTTKAQSRIDEAAAIMEEHADVKKRNIQKNTNIKFAATERETRKLLVANNLSKELGGKSLFKNLDFTLSPGSRMGLMGPNGCGKTTLLKMLNEELTPDVGTLKRADDLKVVYFDQHRMKLSGDLTLRDALAPSGEFVTFRGSKIHINAWCERFLFSRDLLGVPINTLSGGERARITIAHLMLQPADVLLLDEPTNDLDIPTLETFEESLKQFPGAIVLITHDRCMLDRICTSLAALGDGEKPEIYSDYAQWESSCKKDLPLKKTQTKTPKSAVSYAKKKQADAIERKITKLEAEIESNNVLLEDEGIAGDLEKLSTICKKTSLLETQLTALYIEWEELGV